MPLMRIDMYRGRSKAEIKKILDIAYQVATEELHLLPRDRYQIVTQHDPEEMIVWDVGLGFDRTEKTLIVSLTSSPREEADKERFYARLVKELAAGAGVPPTDVLINITTNTKADWSFGNGEAQFMNGKL
ncbi:tautomerase family protein [Levilactobacillus tujiorum]|uniref:Tautomerase family protein n=1 Tax=Levilactobacillus tujiorum TaxID=2912243 RepID=A0ABX1L6M4_9LACO|nr:tautomerase family protein [Levilactobacillus tujiorum]MCH5465300.1 tautomerase family protein [Levilactobacillus tujiorum]NLR12291.1 tautomerase family protein [Lactobacillus sp. HBUAS51387]NLR30303.1 tautomerase family protein [Levilactobacillus tujiorum]NLR31984.1 tautomerase family protein [Levilactobacillus tujiorum]